MRRADEPESRGVEKSEGPREKGLLDRLGRFADYITPKIKELLSYSDDKMRFIFRQY